ncbi:hypothetical protein [Curtobacterium ammoniigenes]|uniref:hypothetical protein n=1 Tax=Curtobacterium ammoniigenes TaxID=395387 RepID=UPI000AC91BD8|nr:hypothetical protein [Curtobacterium ammoniigenes]
MLASALVAHTMTPGVFVGSAPFTIQLGNLIVIIAMLIAFALAIVLPFPGDHRRSRR